MTPAQCRMARAALEWNASQLAASAGVGVATVNRFERGGVVTTEETVTKLRAALEGAGVEFIPEGPYQGEGGPGARVRTRGDG
ncbi:helix-turn-helix domain-containing protein [Azospirillum argentinense]